jgi:hypothetical protein
VGSCEVGSSQDDSGLGEHFCGCCVGWLDCKSRAYLQR